MNKPIEAAWKEVKETITLPSGIEEEECLNKLRLIYFTGASALYKLILTVKDEDTSKLYDALYEEFEEFRKSRIRN